MSLQGTLVALALTAGTVLLVASRRSKDTGDGVNPDELAKDTKGTPAGSTTAEAPAESPATKDTTKAPPPFRESDLLLKQPYSRFQKPYPPPPPQISPREGQPLPPPVLRARELLTKAKRDIASITMDEAAEMADLAITLNIMGNTVAYAYEVDSLHTLLHIREVYWVDRARGV